jgi:prepilin-type N-terminal cleavage/methylation domain-containing protein
MNKNKGFTLIELLIVIAVLSILAIASITTYSGVRLKALRTEAYSNLENLRLLEEQFFAENGRYTDSLADVAAIQTVLRGFQPGAGRMYNYRIEQDVMIIDNAGVTKGLPPQIGPDDGDNTNRSCFVAIAEGIPGTRVEDDFFAIDCRNNRNF